MAKEFNYFYKIENIISGKFYYGVHATNNLEDEYMGSGVRIQRAIKKYGKENFKKEILTFFDTYDKALDYEAEIVNESLLLDASCYNLKQGGKGGNNGKGEEWYKNHYSQIGKIVWQNEEYKKHHIEKQSILWKQLRKNGLKIGAGNFQGKKHDDKTKKQIGEKNSVKQRGNGNSQYGTCWITNEKENKKIHKGDLIPYGWRLGRKVKLEI